MKKLKDKIEASQKAVKQKETDGYEQKQLPPKVLGKDVSRTGKMNFEFSEEMTIPGFLTANKKDRNLRVF